MGCFARVSISGAHISVRNAVICAKRDFEDLRARSRICGRASGCFIVIPISYVPMFLCSRG